MSDKRGVERSMSSLYIMRQPCRNIGILPHSILFCILTVELRGVQLLCFIPPINPKTYEKKLICNNPART